MSLLTQMPTFAPSPSYYTDAYSEFDELERPTLSFRQLRVALPHFLFEELFESGKKAKAKVQQPTIAPSTVAPTASSMYQAPMFPREAAQAAYFKQQQQQQHMRMFQQQPHAASPAPVARNPTRQSRQRSDSESSSSSADSMKLAASFAASASAKGARRSPSPSSSPSSPTRLRNTESASEQLLMRCIRELPAELRECFTEWRRERKEAILAHDLEKQRAVEKVMWTALQSIQSSSFGQ